jgi:class 3 adenylate cyclase
MLIGAGMEVNNYDELLKRIARLVRENQELEENVRVLEKLNDKLTLEIERFKARRDMMDPDLHPEAGPGKREPSRKFNMATVLHSDIRGFSKLVEGMNSTAVMDELDEILFRFDEIIKKYKLEKIKTIGDTIMCAGGIPDKNMTNPVDVVMAALEMRSLLGKFESERRGRNRIWELKTGIHTGPVTATLSGKRKVSYDIKGDTVNTASRVEAVSEYGSILISLMTYEMVREFFDCEFIGRLPVKYKGELDLFRVFSLKPEFSEDSEGIMPNEAFRVKFGLIRFNDMQEMILDKLEKELPPYLYYHNIKHTVDVVTEAELIGWGEGCSDEEILLLKTAGLFHDAGHTVDYDNHEFYGAELARQILPGFGYSPGQIERICSMILATKLPPSPRDLLESIICDSDLDYLGRSDFIPVSNSLFEELKARKKMSSINEWNKLQVKFISGHQYFTSTARSLREVNKQLQIERIQSLISG